MLATLALPVALAAYQPLKPAGPADRGPAKSSVRDQGAVRTLNLHIGESVVLTFDPAFKPVLQSASIADPQATAARLPLPIDLQTPETATGISVSDKGADPKRLNKAAPGTVIMTLVPYKTGTLLLVENGLSVPVRYHAATMQALPGGGARGSSTTLCPAEPGIGVVETWAARFTSLLVIKFEPAAPADDACRT